MTEAVYCFWAIVACLAVAAACNHGWHHARDRHPTARLTRPPARDRHLALSPTGTDLTSTDLRGEDESVDAGSAA